MVGDDLRVVAANRQVCATISEITFGNLYSRASAGQKKAGQWPASYYRALVVSFANRIGRTNFIVLVLLFVLVLEFLIFDYENEDDDDK